MHYDTTTAVFMLGYVKNLATKECTQELCSPHKVGEALPCPSQDRTRLYLFSSLPFGVLSMPRLRIE